VGIDELGKKGRLALADRDVPENIIAPILTGFWTEIRHDFDTPGG
jgi:hypothetical protein